MYRKRARAAHVLQPAANTAAAPPPQSTAPLRGDVGNEVNNQPQHSAFNQASNLAGQPQFFNPMTYQNGYNYEQPSYPNSGDQPQEMPARQDPSPAMSQQQVASGDGQLQGGVAWNNAANYPQGSSDIVSQQPQTEQSGVQENLWSGQTNDQQDTQTGQSWANYQQPVNHSSGQQQQDQPVTEQGGQQELGHTQQYQQANQQQQNSELYLDPSGQWCWDYYAQQWTPYFAGQQVAGGTEMANAAEVSPTAAVDSVPADSHQPNIELVSQGELGEERQLAGSSEVQSEMPRVDDGVKKDAEPVGEQEHHHPYEEKTEPQPSTVEYNHTQDLANGMEKLDLGDAAANDIVSSPPTSSQFRDLPGQEEGIYTGQVSNEIPLHHNEVGSEVDREPFPPTVAPSQAMGPPDLVNLRQYNRPEIVQDTPVTDANQPAQSPPDMFVSLPISSYTYSAPSVSHATLSTQPEVTPGEAYPEAEVQPALTGQSIIGQKVMTAAPDLTAQSVVSASANKDPVGSSASEDALSQIGHSNASLLGGGGGGGVGSGAAAHDQHYDFYKDQIESAMPDLTSGQRSTRDASLSRSNLPPRRSSQDKAPDILRTEPLVPTTDRNLYMETGELQEEDVQRVTHEMPSLTGSILEVSAPSASTIAAKPPSDLPPMVGGNEPPMLAGPNEPPSIVRMVVGESVTAPIIPPPAMIAIPPTNQRLVEGESTHAAPMPLPSREIEGEVGSDARGIPFPNAIDRTIEGEDERSNVPPVGPPPVQTREVEGEPQPLPPPVAARLPPPQPSAMRLPPMRAFPGNQPQALTNNQDFGVTSSAISTPLDASPIHEAGAVAAPQPPPVAASLSPNTEVRSAAAGSEKRDTTVMGGPPPPVKAPPLPTPGRDVAGQESSQSQGYAPPPRRRGDDYKKSTFDSDDDNIPESESERNIVQKQRIKPRRNLSPKTSRTARPVKGYDRPNRSSTDRDDDSDRRHDYYRDDDDYYNGNRSFRNHDRRKRDYDRRHYYDDRDDDRRSLHGGRDDDRRSMRGGRDDDRRSVHGRAEDDRRSYQGGRKQDHQGRYRDRDDYRRNRMDSDMDRESYYGDDYMNRSRPGSRAGSVSHYDPNESMYSRVGGVAGGMSFFPHLIQQQYQYQMQYQVQTAVQEMEKSPKSVEHLKPYKAYWDTYGKQPQLMEKLRLENPVLHHVLIHFERNYLHLFAEDAGAAGKKVEKSENVTRASEDSNDKEVEEFVKQFHQASPSHRPESREVGQESTIYGPQETTTEHSTSAPILPSRLTPLMFSRPHVCARVSASGLLVKVEAHSPREGQSATVELHSVSSLLQHTQNYKELSIFPGPLKPKETHRNDVMKFCERKIHEARERRMVDKDSYELIWRMLILLLRQKGQVEGSDLADLLIMEKNRMDTSLEGLPADRSRGGSSYRGQMDAEETASMSSFSEDPGERTDRTMSSKTYINSGASQEEYVAKFRSYLLHGNKQEGLEFAMNVGLWGHALFLASKMDQRTYANVMTRFANGLAVNDPLQTLYQLMSARIPAAMKNFADQRLGDWRPHLAMILSNPYPGSDINRRSMKTLGDTLLSKGQIYAAQFCYIVSALEFGTFSKKTSKLVLLLSMPGDKSVEEFASNEAIQCTQIYEFVQKLGCPNFEMPTLQPFKLLYAIRLLEAGLVNQAQAYCREIAQFVINNPNNIVTDFLPEFLQQLETLSDRLKYQDPLYTTSSGEWNEIPDPDWLVKLRETVQNITYGGVYTASETTEPDATAYSEPQSGQYESYASYGHQHQQQVTHEDLTPGDSYSYEQTNATESREFANNNEVTGDQPPQSDAGQEHHSGVGSSQQIVNGWGAVMQPISESVQDGEQADQAVGGSESQSEPAPAMFNPADYQSTIPDGSVDQLSKPASPAHTPMYDPRNVHAVPSYDTAPPTLPGMLPVNSNHDTVSSIDHGSRKASVTEDTRRNSVPPSDIGANAGLSANSESSKQEENSTPSDKPEDEKKMGKNGATKKSSWLGGFIGKILRPPNQVHLPDDTHKTIYYDEKLGRWVNTEEDESASAPAAPPPMDPAFMNKSMKGGPPTPLSTSTAPASPGDAPPVMSTSFRAPRMRGRAAYVDVNRQSGLAKPMSVTAAGLPPMLVPGGGMTPDQQPASLPPMLFNPGPPMANGENGPSSLQPSPSVGDEPEQPVGDGVAGAGGASDTAAPAGVPMMFNPSSMGSVAAPPTF